MREKIKEIVFYFTLLNLLVTPNLVKSNDQNFNDIKRALITNQVVSLHCQELIEKHQQYLLAKQKIYSLIDIDNKLKKKNIKNIQRLDYRLKRTKDLLVRKKDYVEHALMSIELEMINFGCPGFTL